MSRLKPREWWGVKNPYHESIGICPHDCFALRRDAIKDVTDNYIEAWKSLYRKGFRIVKVTINEVQK